MRSTGLSEACLQTIAMVLCDRNFWMRAPFTEEQLRDFENIVRDCIEAAKAVAGCEWMARDLTDTLETVKTCRRISAVIESAILGGIPNVN